MPHEARERGVWYVMAAALAALAVAVSLRWALDPVLGDQVPVITVMAAVVLMGWWRGALPALTVLLVGFPVCLYLFVPPRGVWWPASPVSWTVTGAYFVIGLVVSWLAEQRLRVVDRARRADLELRRSRATLESITDEMPACVTRCGRDLRYHWVNRAYAEHFFGTSPERIIGRTIEEVMGAPALAAIRPYIERVLAGETIEVEVEVPYPTLGTRWSHAVCRPTRDGAGVVDGWLAHIADVTERVRAELALHESESRFRAMADNAPVLMWMSGTDGKATYVNRGWLEFTGRTMGQELGDGWIEGVHPDDRDACMSKYLEALRARREFNLEYRLRRHDGEYRWILDHGGPRVAPGGEFMGCIGSCIDITERKQSEEALARHHEILEAKIAERTAALERMNARARAAERHAALGTLAAGLGHDLANLLFPVRTRLEVLERMDLPGPAREEVSAIRGALGYVQRLSTGLRLVASDPEGQSASTPTRDLTAWWADVETVLRTVLPAGATLEGDISRGLGVHMARHHLTQAVFNQVQNAADAMAGRRSGVVRVCARAESAERVVVSVSDDGPGMPPDVQARCFDPYFSTKSRTISTGLGLALVRGLVENADGSIEVESVPGTGTTFVIRLPGGADRPERAGESPSLRAVISTISGRTKEIAAAMLRSMGLSVVTVREFASADLWVTDEPERDRVAAFLEDKPGRCVVVCDEAPPEAPRRAGDGVVFAGREPKTRELRRAIMEAASRVTPRAGGRDKSEGARNGVPA